MLYFDGSSKCWWRMIGNPFHFCGLSFLPTLIRPSRGSLSGLGYNCTHNTEKWRHVQSPCNEGAIFPLADFPCFAIPYTKVFQSSMSNAPALLFQTSKTTLRDENWLSKVCLEYSDTRVAMHQWPRSNFLSLHLTNHPFFWRKIPTTARRKKIFLENAAGFGGSIASMGPDTYFY